MLTQDKLREVDSEQWILRREITTGGTPISMTRCRSGIAVATTQPGRILVLDPDSLQVKACVPVPQIEQVAGCPANDRLFLRVKSQLGYTLAVINLEAERIEHLLSPMQATRRGEDYAGHPVPDDAFDGIAVTDDGRFLCGVG